MLVMAQRIMVTSALWLGLLSVLRSSRWNWADQAGRAGKWRAFRSKMLRAYKTSGHTSSKLFTACTYLSGIASEYRRLSWCDGHHAQPARSPYQGRRASVLGRVGLSGGR
jgi:hypothetical protein